MADVEFYLAKLAQCAVVAPECADESCVLTWAISETQNVQSIYDSSLDAGLSTEEFQQVEELYKDRIQRIHDLGMGALGVCEV